MLQFTKRTGALPQQHYDLQTNQIHKHLFDTFTIVPLGCFRVANLWIEHIHHLSSVEYEQEQRHSDVANDKNEQELHHSNIANHKTIKAIPICKCVRHIHNCAK